MVSVPGCGVRGPRLVVFIANATVICSLGHGPHTFSAVPRSTQPCIPPGSLNRLPASAGVKVGVSALLGGR